MKSRQFSFNCTEDIYQLVKTKAEENGVSMSQQVGDYLNLLKDEMFIQNVGQAMVAVNTTTIDTKLEEQTVALEVAAKQTKIAMMSVLTEQTKLLTDLINDKIKPIGIVLPDKDTVVDVDEDTDFIDWSNDVYETAIRLINRYISLLNQHNYTIHSDSIEQIVGLIGDLTIKLS